MTEPQEDPMFRTLLAATAALALSAPLAPAQEATPDDDPRASFARAATAGNQFEMASSQLALTKSQDDAVRAFAQMMLDDHGAAGDRLMEAAREEGIDLTAMMTDVGQQALGLLDSAEDFDGDFLRAQTLAHEEAIEVYSAFTETAEDGPLRTFAEETLPTLQAHLDEVEQIAGQ
jgi:putative membrane protein